MQISFQLTANDYRQGYYAFRYRTSFSRWRYRIYSVLFFACLGSAILITFSIHGKPDLPVPLYLLCILWAYVLWYCPYAVGNKMIKSNPTARSLHTVDFTDAGIHSRTELSETQMEWESYVGWTENDSVFVVQYSAITFAPIPKRAMTDAQQEEFRILLKQHIKPS